MARNKNYSLKNLVRRLVFSLCLVIAGSWCMLIPRLGDGFLKRLSALDWNLVMFNIGSMEISRSMVVDFAGLSLVFLGFFMAFYYRARLSPRLGRLTDLGENLW